MVPEDLNETEQKVYDAIKNRFCAAFAKDDCVIEQTTVTFASDDGEEFKLIGNVVKQEGFLKFEPTKKEKEKIGRNDPCPCGSGKKYKQCCGK